MKKTARFLLISAIVLFACTIVANLLGEALKGGAAFSVGCYLALTGALLSFFSSPSFYRRNSHPKLLKINILSNTFALESVIFLAAGLLWRNWLPFGNIFLSRGLILPGHGLFTLLGIALCFFVFLLFVARIIFLLSTRKSR